MCEFTPVVSVTMMAYNHEKYIRQAVESVFAQETNFDFEVIVGEDCSPAPDRSREILRELKEKYGERLVLLLHETNQGCMRNGTQIRQRARGRYLASLECDDYWTDVHKLQRQFDFLEAHPEYSACGSDSCMVDDDGKMIQPRVLMLRKDRVLTLRDYKRDGFSVHGNTLMQRAELSPIESPRYQELRASATTMGDIISLCMMYDYGPIYVFREVMHAHREGSAVASSFTSQARDKLIDYSYMQMDIAKALDKYFDYQKDHSFIVVSRLASVLFLYFFFRKNYSATWFEICKLFRANPLSVRVRAVFKSFYHVGLRVVRKLRRQFIRR